MRAHGECLTPRLITMPLVRVVDPERPDPVVIAEAAEAIRAGELVGMPTETVYGLAANALDPAAIARIYAAKGRPAHNPLIAHVVDVAQAKQYAAEWPAMAEALAAKFWPGPLTLVLRRKAGIPDALTAGLNTFGVRVPDHPVALALIRAAGVPLAAPSANKFTEVSPVTAAQVARGLGDAVSVILDAGRTRVGIESTVVDVSGGRAVLLRPGMIGRAELEAVVGPVGRPGAAAREDAPRPAPGMTARHYAPHAQVQLLAGPHIAKSAAELGEHRVGVISWSVDVPGAVAFSRRLPDTVSGYAGALYDALHAADAAGCSVLLIEKVPDDDHWDAVRDRLTRAAHPA